MTRARLGRRIAIAMVVLMPALYGAALFGPLSNTLVVLFSLVHRPPTLDGGPRGTMIHATDGTALQLVNPDRVRVLPVEVRPRHRNIDLFLRYEDNAFHRHRGVDVRAIGRAIYHSVTYCSIDHCHIVSGASTITMQLVKLLRPRPRTWLNKALEALEARQLERRYDKPTLLAAYLNRVPMPEGMLGVNTAAYRYFGKDFYALDLAELALVASMPQAPARMHPLRSPDNALRQRNKLLERWLAYGDISQAEHDDARSAPLAVDVHPFPFNAPHYGFRIALRSENQGRHAIAAAIAPALQQRVAGDLRALSGADGVTAAGAVFNAFLDEFVAYHGSHRYSDTRRSGNLDQLYRRRLPCELIAAAVLADARVCSMALLDHPLRDLSLKLREPLDGGPLDAAQFLRALAATGRQLRCPSDAADRGRVCSVRDRGPFRSMVLRAATYTALVAQHRQESAILVLSQPGAPACIRCPRDPDILEGLEELLWSWLRQADHEAA